MRGREFLAVTKSLRDYDGEAYARTRTGRGYYAAYIEARSFCERHLGYVRTKSSREHQDVPSLLLDLDRELVVKLTLLRMYGNAADYDMQLSPETVAGTTLIAEKFAVEIIAGLDALTDSRASETHQFPTIEPGP